MAHHRRTDPGCMRHRLPRTAFGKWRFERARGRECPVCYPGDRRTREFVLGFITPL